MRRFATSLAVLCTQFAFPLAAQQHPSEPVGIAAPIPLATDAPLAPVTTRHWIRTGKGSISYQATWFETVLKAPDGSAQATISATSYVRDDVRSPRKRPVLVMFNGGPGASSSPLQFGAFGPRRYGSRGPGEPPRLIDNPATLLDAADLVFVDPVGTGFSRPLREGGGKAYWSVAGDAGSVLALVRSWLRTQGRTASPLFFAGESYGGYRLGVMAKDMGDLNVVGLILLSPALDFAADADQAAVNALPAMAVAAWQHGKGERAAASVGAAWEEARSFAQGDYAVALQQGSALPAAERNRIAARIAGSIGLPAAQIAAAGLKVDSQTFLESLLPGQIVGRLDTRVAVPRPDRPLNPDRPAGANDPSLGLGRTNVIVSQQIGDYLRNELRVPTARDYFSLTLDVNFNWNWAGDPSRPEVDRRVAPNLATLMRLKPAMRLLVLGGYYDLAVPLLAPRYALTHSNVPLDRTLMVALPTGHSTFEGAANLSRVSAMIHAFVTGEKTP